MLVKHVTLQMINVVNAGRPSGNSAESTVVQIDRASEPREGAVVQEKIFWTPQKILFSVVTFFLSGVAEIGGGWLVFQAIRSDKPFWWGILGSLILVIYGFIPTLQPISNFGRVFAVYGG